MQKSSLVRISHHIGLLTHPAATAAAGWWFTHSRRAFACSPENHYSFRLDLEDFITGRLDRTPNLLLTSVGGPQTPLSEIAFKNNASLDGDLWPSAAMHINTEEVTVDILRDGMVVRSETVW